MRARALAVGVSLVVSGLTIAPSAYALPDVAVTTAVSSVTSPVTATIASRPQHAPRTTTPTLALSSTQDRDAERERNEMLGRGRLTVPDLNMEWLTRLNEGYTGQGGQGAGVLQDLVGGVIAVGLVLCGIGFLLGVAGWAIARTGIGLGGRDQAFFASRAALAILAAVLIASIAGAVRWGAIQIGGLTM